MSSARKVNVAAIALATVDGMVQANYARAIELGKISLRGRPQIVLFPEAFAAGYCGTDMARFSESPDSANLEPFRTLSEEGDCTVVLGYLEGSSEGVRNAAVVYERGRLLGRHYKRSLWSDAQRPYRDEVSLLVPGKEIEVFASRTGRFAVLICYENMLEEDWLAVAAQVDFVVSIYNCEGDPAHNNIKYAGKLGLPSAWADRTGTVYCGDGYKPNMGTAGIVDGHGQVIACSPPGVEQIVTADLPF